MTWNTNKTPNKVITDLGELAPGLRVRIEAWSAESAKGERGGLVISVHDAAKLSAGKDSCLISFGAMKAKVMLTLGFKGLVQAFKALATAEAARASAEAASIEDTRKRALAVNAAKLSEAQAMVAAIDAEAREAA